MIRRLITVTIVAMLLPGMLWGAPLDAEIERHVSDGASRRAHWGAYAVNASTGEVLAEVNADRLFVPASSRKLVTAAMAVRFLGGSKTFETVLHAPGGVSGSTVAGDLVVRASGDPSWTADLRGGRPGSAVLRRLAEEVAAAGIRAVAGDLVIDTSAFSDPAPIPEGWEWADFQTIYGSIPSVFGIDKNLVGLTVEPTGPGESVRLEFASRTVPFELDNRATTGRASSAPTFVLTRGLEGRTLTATGSIPADAGAARRSMAVGDPVGHAARELAALLEEEGISISGEVRLEDERVELGEVIVTVRSVSVAEMLAEMNRTSDNFLAEQVYLLAGGELFGKASYDSGRAAEKRLWEDLDVESTAWEGADGSGLSRLNLITPRAMGKLLVEMRDRETFVSSLAVSGHSGTLRYRFVEEGLGGRVRAKTGTLTGVVSLCGYVTDNGGDTVAFAVFANHFDASPAPIRNDVDKIVEMLAR